MSIFFFIIILYILYTLLFFLKINNKLYILFICLTLPIPGYFHDPISVYMYNLTGEVGYADTYRIFNEMDLFRQWGWDAFSGYDGSILAKVYIYFFAMLGNNNILSFFNALVVYSLALYTINKIGKYLLVNDNIRRFSILYITLFTNYFYVCTNIRQQLAITVCFFFLAYDLIEKRHRIICFLSYCITGLLHPSVLILVVLRPMLSLPYKLWLCIIPILIVMENIFMDNIINILLFSNIDFLTNLAWKQIAYNGEQEIFKTGVYFKCAVGSIDFFLVISSLFLIKYLSRDILKKYKKVINLGLIMGCIGILTIIMDMDFLGRIEFFGIYIIGVYIFLFNKKVYFDIKNNKYYRMFLIYIILLSTTAVYGIYMNIINAMKNYHY